MPKTQAGSLRFPIYFRIFADEGGKGGRAKTDGQPEKRQAGVPQVINKKGDLSTVFAFSSLFMLALSEIIAYFAADK
nr:hypothetical protein [uncultured Bacteroides sp.]